MVVLEEQGVPESIGETGGTRDAGAPRTIRAQLGRMTSASAPNAGSSALTLLGDIGF